MSSAIGNIIRTTVFGESHGPAIGAVMDAPPAGYKISYGELAVQMKRRAPGTDPTATARREADEPEILSGIMDGITTGAPLALIIRNADHRSSNYDGIKAHPRPSHADYAASVRYKGFNDIRGGGNFSGRLTAPLTAAGSIARQILSAHGISVGGHVSFIGSTADVSFDPTEVSSLLLDRLNREYFSVISDTAKADMEKEIADAKAAGDSIGGEIEIAVTGLAAGIGSPTARGVENMISAALFAVPAIKGIEFGTGFSFSSMKGSEANDCMYYADDGSVRCYTNNCGGITGGITNGMPLIIRAAVKPTPSISMPQRTVDLENRQNDTFTIVGRHDPCIVPRALPAAEAAVCLALIDLLAEVHAL